ncbi:uncharacterized protein EI97DRAFT_491207 [Westerdykella ornata]|uniref:Uncharacterized protein n=1 Tax=Westerdykella ornata TaxID=318751 RepID=A0A6A6JX85_WESOR|nr:uncharacterized protein EI97DRAFT_491207 [Westerdykella ornata]KAF2281231.1 hypothetical protein EI97DRAFT_491207 [Westerdykella ornata]
MASERARREPGRAETPAQSPARNVVQMQVNPTSVQQLRAENSWIEIASRQSSSSLSSADNEIITTGLRVQHDSNLHRRRRSRTSGQFVIGTGYRATSAGGGGSSQEEYEESESESDRVMTSSNEGIGPSPLQYEVRRPSRDMYSATSSETTSEREGDFEYEDDDDENATAVNYPRSSHQRTFEPRPNAFSHPPTSTDEPRIGASSYPPNRRPTTRSARHSYPQHSPPYGGLSPHRYHAEHDEALRASLSTLLSAAAAVRSLPKQGRPKNSNDTTSSPSPSTRVDPTSLRLVPESVVRGETPSPARTRTTTTTTTTTSSPDPPTKRKAAPQSPTHQQPPLRSSSKDRRATKKARTTGAATALGIDDISPTLLTWVVSAGVVVLVSALSFSAGYVVGKETGHAEVMGELGGAAKEAGRCGREAVGEVGRGATAGLGLRRLRWGGQGVRV